MRRIAAVALITATLLITALALPYRAARTPTGQPQRAGADEIQTVDGRLFGEMLEGDGPPLDSLPPGVLSKRPAPPEPIRTDDIPAPAGYPVDFEHYPSPDEINAFLDALERDYPDLVEGYEIGRTWHDRPIRAMRVASEKAGDRIADRPVMYIDGQHHARELISNQVALYTLWWLVHFYGQDPLATYLLDTRTLYVNPSVNPDGAAVALVDNQNTRKTANPSCCDDDGDGRFDEDSSVGYGFGSETVTVFEFDQSWADQHPTNPFDGDWRAHIVRQEPPARYTGAYGGPRRLLPQQDMDGDGRQNEDEVGGVDPNRNYDWNWKRGTRQVQSDAYRGPAVWSEPETRAVRDFTLELDHLATALSYHSGADVILYPWAWSVTATLPAAPLYELLGRKGSQLTEVNGFAGSPRVWIARGLYEAHGSSVDYIYGKLGALNWAPEVYSGDLERVERLGSTGVFSRALSYARGFTPAPDQILASTDRWNRFALYILAATPNIELNALAVEGDQLVLRFGNDGALPVSLDVELDARDGRTLRATDGGPIHGWQTTFAVPLADIRHAGNRLRISATLLSGTRPHVIETAQWVFTVTDDGAVRLDQGRLAPFVDLGAHFGGWWAGEEWNAPQYRCNGSQCPDPIVADPPAAPDPNRPPIAAWTPGGAPATDTPAAPTPVEPTPTEPTAVPTTPERGGTIYLPRAITASGQ